VFAAAVEGIVAARAAGFQVCTNTTVYRDTDMREIAVLFGYLEDLGVDGLMISPAFSYAAVSESDPDATQRIFMTRGEVHEKFQAAEAFLARFRLAASPLYLEFLRGERELNCAAWANPTYNVRGWRGPCYLLGDAHYASYAELLRSTDWTRCGPDGDTRCANCLVHCGFEPAAVLRPPKGFRDLLRMAVWQMG
jgi:hopanoid biosynthesis associated radical SAM protein HpnH